MAIPHAEHVHQKLDTRPLLHFVHNGEGGRGGLGVSELDNKSQVLGFRNYQVDSIGDGASVAWKRQFSAFSFTFQHYLSSAGSALIPRCNSIPKV
jgi:hypothetical protein